jgi:hypothetical protein
LPDGQSEIFFADRLARCANHQAVGQADRRPPTRSTGSACFSGWDPSTAPVSSFPPCDEEPPSWGRQSSNVLRT